MKPTVYIETTIPANYGDERPELRNDVARTRAWWDHERTDYECFISSVVLDELQAGQYPAQSSCLDLVEHMALLEVVNEVVEIADAYRARRLMPHDPAADALHLALASYYRMDYLLTWNCRHIANANKIRHLEVLNTQMGLAVPVLVTPHMLLPPEMES